MSMKWTTNCSTLLLRLLLSSRIVAYAEGTPNPPAAVSNSISIAFAAKSIASFARRKRMPTKAILKARGSLAADERDADES
jgi:hypothetical protein